MLSQQVVVYIPDIMCIVVPHIVIHNYDLIIGATVARHDITHTLIIRSVEVYIWLAWDAQSQSVGVSDIYW